DSFGGALLFLHVDPRPSLGGYRYSITWPGGCCCRHRSGYVRFLCVLFLFFCRCLLIWVFVVWQVVGCTRLKDTEWISRQDPYVCLEYASTKYRTRTCTDGGKNPTFQEKFVFNLIEGLREISISVWNSNTLTFDDFIGNGKVQLHKALSQGYDDAAWTIQSKSGRYAGEVTLIMHYGHAQRPGVGYAPTAPPYAPAAAPYTAAPAPYPGAYPAPAYAPPALPPTYPGYPPATAAAMPYPCYPPNPAAPYPPAGTYPPAGYPPSPALLHLPTATVLNEKMFQKDWGNVSIRNGSTHPIKRLM
ncbi:hypothetical protein Taro_048152, partial [Colocasia esculenta]|nr:hypothetical protein [Colocasia esculenta]